MNAKYQGRPDHLLAVVVAIGIVASGVVSARRQQRTTDSGMSKQTPVSDPLVARQDTPEVAGIEALRAASPEERLRAAYFGHQGFNIVRLWQLGQLNGGEPVGDPAAPNGLPDKRTDDDKLRDMLCGYDSVMLGTPNGLRVLLSDDETSLFTDYTISVERWIMPLVTSKTATVSELGGRVVVTGKPMSMFMDCELDIGKRYLLYGRKIPQSDSVRLMNAVLFPIDTSSNAARKNADNQAYIDHIVALATSCRDK